MHALGYGCVRTNFADKECTRFPTTDCCCSNTRLFLLVSLVMSAAESGTGESRLPSSPFLFLLYFKFF